MSRGSPAKFCAQGGIIAAEGKGGDHDIHVVVDPQNAIAEINEDNNAASRYLYVNQRPEIILTSPQNGVATGADTINLSISDDNLQKAWYSWDRASTATDMLPPYNCVDVPSYFRGIHILEVWAEDSYGFSYAFCHIR